MSFVRGDRPSFPLLAVYVANSAFSFSIPFNYFYGKYCDICSLVKLPKPSSCSRRVHLCVWSQEGSGYPQVLPLVLGGDFRRLATTLGELDKGAEGSQHINGTGISFCQLGDSDKALPFPYKQTCSMAHLLAWSSHPIIVQPGGHLPENTRIGKFATGATDKSQFSLSESDWHVRVWRSAGECYQACNIIQHDRFGGGSVMVWGGISLEGHTDLHVLNRGNLTGARHKDEILRPIVRPYAGAVGPGFLLVHNNAWPHVVRVCQQFLEDEGTDTIDWPAHSPDLNPIKHLWDIIDQCIWRLTNPTRTVQELTNALVEVWQDIDLGTIHRLIRSMARHCRACIHAHGGHTHY